ncbi:MAG: PKD domain-containing protein, partial [Bacteroidota bacterium]
MALRLKLAVIISLATIAFTFTSFTVCAQVPVANFTASPIVGCSPLFVTFQDLSSGNPTSWVWDFGNGNTSTLQNPSSIYLTPGKYTVVLTVKNANGANTLTRSQYIEVYEIPTVSFTASKTNGCFPLKVQFTDNSSAGAGNSSTAWFWDFGDGSVSTQQNPVHTYTASGSFAVTLKVTNDKGCYRVATVPNYIQTLAELVPGFTNNQPAVCQPPADVTFTNNSFGPGALSYQWNFGDGATSTDSSPLHTYTVKGLYDVSLVVISSTGCTDTLIKTKLIPVGTYSPTFSAPDTVCINSSAAFTNTSSPVPTGVTWDFGDGTTSVDNNPTKVYSTAGVYSVKMVANYGSCIDSVSKNITVLAKPVVDFTAPIVNGCQPPLTVNFQDQSTNAASWQWNFGDGATSNLQNPSHSYTSLGNYDVTLIVSNAFGCIDSITKPAFVKIAKPVITIPSLPTAGCVPFTINPVATITSVDAVVSYLWDFGDGTTSTLQNPSHTYPSQGTYTVSLKIITATGCTETLVINNAVSTGTLPTVDFAGVPLSLCVDQGVQFTDNSSSGTSWLWNFGDMESSTQKNPLHFYTYAGTFSVTLTVSNNGCPATVVKTNYITVNPPEASFTFTPDCNSRKHFIFTDASIDALTWFWDFGDGTTSTDQSPVHDYAALGTYSVSLTTTNGTCSNTFSRTIHAIDENPDILAIPNPGCRKSPIGLSAINIAPNNISSYNWDFGDGSTSTVSVNGLNHTYNTSGNYTISLTTTDINGCTDNITKANFLRINGPTANFSATNTSGCQGLTTTFNDLSTTDGVNAITNWQWDFGDGSIQNFATGPFQHAYLNAGTYSVKLKVTDASGCSDTLTIPDLIITTDP